MEDPKRFGRDAGSILQDWVVKLPLFYQGVLISAIRGCDAVPKEDPCKALTRVYRACILNAPTETPPSFMEFVEPSEMVKRCRLMMKNCDHLPNHFIMHTLFGIEILGYEHPAQEVRDAWLESYKDACRRLHLNFESRQQLDKRLTNIGVIFAPE